MMINFLEIDHCTIMYATLEDKQSINCYYKLCSYNFGIFIIFLFRQFSVLILCKGFNYFYIKNKYILICT